MKDQITMFDNALNRSLGKAGHKLNEGVMPGSEFLEVRIGFNF